MPHLRFQLYACVSLLVLAAPLDLARAQTKPLIEAAAQWQLLVIPVLDEQVKAIERLKAQPKNIELASMLEDAHAATRLVTMKVHSYVLDRTEANETAVLAAMLEFCSRAKRVSNLLGHFESIERTLASFGTLAMQSFLREEIDHDAVRQSCAD